MFLENCVLFPARKKGFDGNSDNDKFTLRPAITLFAPQTSDNDDNEGCHSGKGMVYQKQASSSLTEGRSVGHGRSAGSFECCLSLSLSL